MAHPSRQEHFGYLRDTLGDCTIPISVDDGCGIWENCKKAWRLRDPEAEYHLVLQDDAIICDNFKELAIKEIEKSEKLGCGALSFYFGKRMGMRHIGKEGMKNGYVINALHWGLAICMPTKLIEEMIAFGDKLKIKQDDARISRFFRSKKMKVYFPMPSLIEHRTGDSLVGDPGRFRKAFCYIGDVNK